MELNYDVPFYANTEDNTHCFQAALKMVLKYFQPEKDFSWEELDRMTAKEEGMWTWPMAGLMWMKKNGFEVIDVEMFDYGKFIELGEKYLEEEYGKEIAEANARHSDIGKEQERTKEFLKVIEIEKRIPVAEDLRKLLTVGYLAMCNVNSRVLNEREGYAGHIVVVEGFDEDGFIIHDPGLPGLENRKVPYDIFEKSWAYPDERAKNIMAFRI